VETAIDTTVCLWPFTGFNGATAIQPWKLREPFREPDQTKLLQWGHGYSAVETSQFFIDIPIRIRKLQWGHGYSAVETTIACSRQSEHSLLQWGHGYSAVETARRDVAILA